MFKSKHSGWTWELKRTPFGGGGGGFVSAITDPISSALGTDGSGGGALGALASIDPGPAIGSDLASVDQAVNNSIPGGWVTVAGAALGGAALAYAPEVMALSASEGITPEAAAIATGTAPIDVATGATVPLDTLAADTVTSTAGADSVLSAPDVAVNLGATNGGMVGSLNPALPAAGAPVGTSVGLSGALSPGTILGTGAAGGGAIGASYAAGANGLPATDFFGNYIPASSINTGGVPNTIAGTTASTTNTNSDLLKLLRQGAGSGLSSSLGKLAQGANPSGIALSSVVRGNQNPFVMTQNLPIQNNNQTLASLLKQG
jgi:hypothetical protein